MRQDPYSIQTPAPASYAPTSSSPPVYTQPYAHAHAQQFQSSPPPVFVRQAAPTPYGYTANPQTQHPYGQRNDLSAPPPPHSLAPMAMSADSTNRQFAITGSGAQHLTMSGRDKPSIKWGIMIALSGALLGGVLGLGMDARRQSARAAAAAEANDAAPPAVVATVQPVQPVQPVVIAPTVIAPTVALGVQPTGVQPQILTPAPVVLAVGQGVVVPRGAVRTKPIVKPHGFLAAKVTSPSRPAPEPKAEAPEPKTAKADKADSSKTFKKDANTSDAMKILEAANKDTTNTL